MTDNKKTSVNEPSINFPQGVKIVAKSENVEVIKDESSVKVLVTNVFCPNGHNLINENNEKFDGYPGIKLAIEGKSGAGFVTLSPFHGDKNKISTIEIKEGEDCTLKCPECGIEMPVVTRCSCGRNGRIYSLYLTPKLDHGEMVGLCSIWGCTRSKVIDNFEIISEIISSETGSTWNV